MNNKKYTTYPKSLGQAEIHTKNIALQNKLTLKINDNEEELLERLHYTIFELNSGLPYIFDAINYICTHGKEFIERIGNPQETHYQVKIPHKHFLDFALDGYLYNNSKINFYKQLQSIIDNAPVKVLPFSEKHDIKASPITIKEITKKDKTNIHNIKKMQDYEITDYYIIEFYKPLWASLLENDKPNAWFAMPKAFHAKLNHIIHYLKNNDETISNSKDYGNISNYRKLYLYLNLHDNNQSKCIQYDLKSLISHCLPSMINNDGDIRSWEIVKGFVDKGILTLHKMCQMGLMDGIKFKPYSTYVNTKDNIIRISIIRENINIKDLPPYESTY